MKSKKIILILYILLTSFFFISLASAAITISSCNQDINASGSYILNQSITSNSTCLTTNSSNVEINCAGNTITYGTAGTANSIGISALHPTISQVNLTIKNCILVKTSAGGSGGNGIMLTRFANSTIVNNTIRNNGTSGNKGIYVLTGSNRNNISRNTIITGGSSTTNYGIFLYTGSADSIIEYNDITTGKGTATTDNYGIRVDDPRANITGNTIYTFGSGDSNFGIYSYTSTSARIINNTICTSGTTGNNIGIYVSTADYNYVANNTINTTGQSSPGIYLTASGATNVLNNKINSTADGVYITSSILADFTTTNITRDNTRFGRNITFYGGGAANLPCPNNQVIDNPSDGGLKFISCNNVTVKNWYRPNRDTDTLLFVNSNNNTIINNTLNGGIYGLALLTSVALCNNNLIINNTFSSFGYLNSNAINIYGSYNIITGNNLSTYGVISGNIALNVNNDFNNITNNIITTSGTSGNIGIDFGVAADDNLIENNTITTSGTSGNSGIYFESTNRRNIVRNNTITATGITSGNLGIRLVTNSDNNLIEYNTIYTKGLTSGNNGIDLSSSDNNTLKFNSVYAGYGVGTTDNDAISLVSSRNNTFSNNILFANGTATSMTSAPIFLQSNSVNNTFANNVILKSVGNAIELDFSTTYPHRNIFQNNSLNNVSGSDLFFLDANINDTILIDQPIGKYNFTGIGGTIVIENTLFGKIVFTSFINGSNGNLTNDIQIGFNFAQVTDLKSGLNASANITFYNLPVNFTRPTILKDGSICSTCQNFTSLNAGNVSFSVLSWSNYTIAEYPNLNPPVISSLSLTTTDPLKNDTNQNLSASWLVTDADNDSFFNITDWRVNGNSIALLNLPFEAGSSNLTYTKDYSSYGNNGNVTGATLNSTGGYLGGGYFFNADDLITINNGFDYSQGAITFWINEKASATSNSMGIFTKLGNPAYMSDIVTAIFSTTVANSAYLGFGVYNNNGVGANGYAWRYDNLNFYNTGWHHVVIQANSNGNEVYIDGQKVSPTYSSGNSSSTGWLDFPAQNTNFRLGCRMGGSSCLYWLDSATIDDFRIYNQTLSSQQVSAIYKNRTDLIVSQELTIGKNWSYCLTASDRTHVSSTNCSNSITILPSDSAPPTILIVSPTNTTYTQNSVFLNYTATDLSGISSCWYKLDSSPNITLPGCTTATISGLQDGIHTIQVYANDTIGNANSSLVVFSIDSVSPGWSNIQTSVPSNYSFQLSIFNITWADISGISSVLLESDFSGQITNYTMTSLGSNKYSFSAILPAGTFYWKSYANDSYGNMNSTSTQIITVNKSSSLVLLYLNDVQDNATIIYNQAINASSNGNIFRNNVLINNSQIDYLGAGYYNYTAFLGETQNFTGSTQTFFLNVTKAIPILNLLINNNPSDLTMSYGTETNVIGFELNLGDADINYNLYKNGIIVSNPEILSLSAGIYNYIYNTSGGENYSSASLTRTLTVNKALSSIQLFLNENEENKTITYGAYSNATVTGTNGNPILYRNGNLVSNSDISVLGAGVYNYTAIIPESENITGFSITRFLTINKATPILNLLIDGSDSDSSYSTGINILINASATLPLGNVVDLYEDDILKNSEVSPSYNINYLTTGNRIWKVNISESENYTYAEKSHTISIIDQDFPQYDSSLRENPSDPATYSSLGNYKFSVNWTDNIGISEVILEFNGVNYSLSSGQLIKNNDEYSKNFSSLAAGNYNYVWYANDTSDNWVSTPIQTYTVSQGIAALFLTMMPGNSVTYGISRSIVCSANSPESQIILTRGIQLVSNPDNEILAAGTYNYACTAIATQNYTSASTTGTLTINKANSLIELKLNRENSNISISSGTTVNISARLISPSDGIINLTIGDILISGQSPLENMSLFSAIGGYLVSSIFEGNNNYSSSSVSRTISVIASSGGNNGGGSSKSCKTNWTCADWGSCINGQQERVCTDLNKCSSNLNKPATIQKCQSCVENWRCANWTDCSVDSFQVRACNDLNSCGISINKPAEIQSCQRPNCSDGIQNHGEFGIDCGGPCANRCSQLGITGKSVVPIESNESNKNSSRYVMFIILLSFFVVILQFVSRIETKITQQKLAGDVNFNKMHFKLLLAHIFHIISIITIFILIIWVIKS